MADEDVATKAPESDAQVHNSSSTMEQEPDTSASLFPNDTPAQTVPPPLSEHCTTDRPTPPDLPQPSGEMTTIESVACYISKPSDYPHNPGKLLLLLTGGTGIQSTNNQLQADAYASRGYLVVMPDQFNGDTAPNTSIPSPSSPKEENVAPGLPTSPTSPSLLERIKLGAAETAKSFLIDMWLARQTPEKVLPIVRKVLNGAKEQFADAVANGNGIYGVGYCFGAKYILLLLGTLAAMKSEYGDDGEVDVEKVAASAPELKVGAIAHGTLVTKEDIEAVKMPISMICVEGDSLFSDEIREQGRASLELNGVDHEIEVFGDVPHGFAVLGDYAEENIRKKQTEAFDRMVRWLDAR